MKIRGEIVWAVVALLASQSWSAEPANSPLFSNIPVWTSGTTQSGGDGNARWIDVDRDGDLDLVTSAPGPRRWVLYANQHGLLAKQPSWESAVTTDCDHISVLDFDGDGWSDLAGTHESHCSLYLNRADAGRAAFARQPSWETSIVTDANQIDFGDIDGDGDLDMLMASGLPVYGLALFENRAGVISKQVSRKIGVREYCETAILTDFDGDGDQDIVAAYGRKGTVRVYRNQAGVFDQGTLVFQDSEVLWCQRIYCIDLDGNGKQELCCARGPWGPPGASVVLARQATTSRMKVVWRSAATTGFHGFDFADVDGDGDLDMAAADWGGRSVSLFLQGPSGLSTAATWSVQTGRPAHEVAFGDVDGDGDPDLAVGCQDRARVYENRFRRVGK